jgi:hypothetical protein
MKITAKSIQFCIDTLTAMVAALLAAVAVLVPVMVVLFSGWELVTVAE